MPYIRPLNFFKRDSALFKAAADNTLTSKKLLEIEYGAFPLKGIDITQPDDRPVALRGYFADKKTGVLGKVLRSALTLGYVSTRTPKDGEAFDRAIYYNQLFHSPLGQGAGIALNHGRLAKAVYFLAYGAGSAAKALAATAAFAKNAWYLGLILLTHARGMLITQALTLPFRASTDTIGHEGIHVLQVQKLSDRHAAEDALREKVDQTRETLRAQLINGNPTKAADNAAIYEDINRTFEDYRAQTTILRNSFNPLSSKICEGLMTYLSRPLKIVAAAEQVLTGPILPYLRNDAEIQARLHTLLAQGYRDRWHQMPATKHELWGALISGGLNAPAAIRKELADGGLPPDNVFYQTGTRAAFNRVALKCTSPHAAEINAAQGSLLTSANRERFWHDVLPYLYGHLLELYGDPQGRARMSITTDTNLRTPADILGAETGRIVRLSDVVEQLRAFTASNPSKDERVLFHTVADDMTYIDSGLQYHDVYVRDSEGSIMRDVYVDAAELAGDGSFRSKILLQTTAVQRLDIFSKCKDYSAEVANGTLKPGKYKPRAMVQTVLGIGI